MSRSAIDNSIYVKQFEELINAEPGQPIIVDYVASNSFRVLFIYYLRQMDIDSGASFRSIRVSKDKMYFFKVDVTKKLNYADQSSKKEVERFQIA